MGARWPATTRFCAYGHAALRQFGTAPRAMSQTTTLLCRLDDLPDGESRGFDPFMQGRDSIFVVRQHEALYAYQNACPHVDGSPLAWRKDRYLNASRSHIICHGHGAEFDITSGLCLLGPCVGQALTPATLNINTSGEVFLARPQPLETTP